MDVPGFSAMIEVATTHALGHIDEARLVILDMAFSGFIWKDLCSATCVHGL